MKPLGRVEIRELTPFLITDLAYTRVPPGYVKEGWNTFTVANSV